MLIPKMYIHLLITMKHNYKKKHFREPWKTNTKTLLKKNYFKVKISYWIYTTYMKLL